MKYGMNLLLWTSHLTSKHFPLLEKLKKTGYDGVEIPIFEGDEKHYAGIKKELDRQGLKCTTVTVMNTGNAFGADTVGVPATQLIFHDASRPSHVTLPIVE